MSTRTEIRPPSTTDPVRPQRPSAGGLSLTQVVGGSLAAATAAALGSHLGVVGTISGAALASVVASLAGALYTTSLRRTRDSVSSVLSTVPRPRRVLAGALVVFLLAAAGITAFELASGASLSGDRGATTLSRSVEGSASSGGPGAGTSPGSGSTATPSTGSSDSPSPSASSSPTATSSGGTTGAPTSAAPSPSAAAGSSSDPTATPSTGTSPTGAPSGTPSASASTTAGPTAGPTAGATAAPTAPAGQDGAGSIALTP